MSDKIEEDVKNPDFSWTSFTAGDILLVILKFFLRLSRKNANFAHTSWKKILGIENFIEIKLE